MLTYYQQDSHRTIRKVKTTQFKTGWIFGTSNDLADIEMISQAHNLDLNIVNDILDPDELPRIEYDQVQNMYVFLRLINFGVDQEVMTYPLLLIATKDNFISLTTGKARLVSQKIDEGYFTTTQIQKMIVEFLRVVISGYDQVLRETARDVADSHKLLKSRTITDEDFFRFVEIESRLYDYQQSMSNIAVVIDRLRDNSHQLFSNNDLEFLADIGLQIKQLKTKLDVNKQSIISIRKIHKTLSDNALNRVMKVLTVSTLLLAIPNLFYGMYGMNIALPFQNHPTAFIGMLTLTLLITFGVIYLARKNKIF